MTCWKCHGTNIVTTDISLEQAMLFYLDPFKYNRMFQRGELCFKELPCPDCSKSLKKLEYTEK